MVQRRQFLAVYEGGRRVGSASFTLFAMPNTLGWARLGLAVGRRVGGAVVRNRVKRRLREIFRRQPRASIPALDIVINALPPSASTTAGELEAEFLNCLARLSRRRT